MPLTATDIAARPRPTHVQQVRLTDAQYELLQEVASHTGQRVGTLLRNVVVVWAMRWIEEGGDKVDVERLVAELLAMEDES